MHKHPSGWCLLDKNQRRKRHLASHDNRADRMALCRRRFIRVSALSIFDGKVLAYRGGDG